ncbi:MAG: large-conductance mechanosensitive channel protein MscL [Alistipes sp.]|nr:large-conductance mechanosensitive channel protein MscL [Alistipes sp.]
MGLLKEFKTFALKGNVVDMAVGIIIGGAFGKIVTSLVNDIIMPPIGMLLGNKNFSELAVTLKPAEAEADAVLWKYGSFIQVCVDFLIVAISVFIMIKIINKLSELRNKEEEKETETKKEEPKPSNEEVLLTEIRDLLKEKCNK